MELPITSSVEIAVEHRPATTLQKNAAVTLYFAGELSVDTDMGSSGSEYANIPFGD